MKTKMKKKTTKKLSVKKTRGTKTYEAHYLLFILAAFLVIEGILIGSSTTADWQKGLAVLDVSSHVSQTATDFQIAFEPIAEVVSNVHQFYQLSATQMAILLDVSDYNMLAGVELVTNSVAEFYTQATNQMIALLDMTHAKIFNGSVAGISISSY